jgi:hypothetical protein
LLETEETRVDGEGWEIDISEIEAADVWFELSISSILMGMGQAYVDNDSVQENSCEAER